MRRFTPFACIAVVLLLEGARSSASPADIEPVLVWEYTDGGAMWIPWDVSFGNRGTQLFWHAGEPHATAFLFSRHAVPPANPVWSVATSPKEVTTFPMKVTDSAADTDVHVSLTQEPVAINQDRHEIHCFRSQGEVWTWVDPQLTVGRYYLRVSRDGQRIVAVMPSPELGASEMRVFSPDAPVMLAAWPLPPDVVWDFALADDGSRAAVNVGDHFRILDVATGQTLFVGPPMGQDNPCALSRDGTVFAADGPGGLSVWRWDGAAYVLEDQRASPPNASVSAIGISDDNSTVAYGFLVGVPGSPPVNGHVEVLDLPTHTVTLQESMESFGMWVNNTLDVALSADGELVVFAQGGDEPQLWEELRIYDKHSSVPLAAIPQVGAVTGVDLSEDGKWLAVAVKNGPAQSTKLPWKGGRIRLYRLADLDFEVVGVPSVGAVVTLVVRGQQGQSALLLAAADCLAPPIVFPGAGFLHLDPASLAICPLGPMGAGGEVSVQVTMPAHPALVGQTVYLQGLRSPPNALTEDWLPFTLLP